MRLRVEVLRKNGDETRLCNILGWCIRSENYDDDTEWTVQFIDLLHGLDRMSEVIERVW